MLRFALIFLILLSGPAQAQSGTTRYFCLFDKYASLKRGMNHYEKDFKIEFIVERGAKRALIIGDNGFEPIEYRESPRAITFTEKLLSGVNQTTTIIKQTGQAAHSRHTLLSGSGFLPSQSYGFCKTL